MASSEIKSGALVTLQDLHPSSPYFKQGASVRVTGKLQDYSVETAIATVVDGSERLKSTRSTSGSSAFELDPSTSSSVNCLFNPIMRQCCRRVWEGMLTALTSIYIISLCNCFRPTI